LVSILFYVNLFYKPLKKIAVVLNCKENNSRVALAIFNEMNLGACIFYLFDCIKPDNFHF